MKLIAGFLIVVSLCLSSMATAQDGGDKFVYADFEKVENGRPVSSNGGLVQIYTAQESVPVKFKGLANASPGAPELIVLMRRRTTWRRLNTTWSVQISGPTSRSKSRGGR